MSFGTKNFEFDISLNFRMGIGHSNKDNASTIVLVESLKFTEGRLSRQKEDSSSPNITELSILRNVFFINLFEIVFFKYFFLVEDSLINILLCLPLVSAFFQYLFIWKVYNNTIVHNFTKIVNENTISSYYLIVMFVAFFFFLLFTFSQFFLF